MKRLIAICFVVLASCGDSSPLRKFTDHCKAAAEKLVETPSTIEYVRKNYENYPEETQIVLKFDAQNAYGALVRHSIRCLYIKPQEDSVEANKIVFNGRALSNRSLTILNIEIIHKTGL